MAPTPLQKPCRSLVLGETICISTRVLLDDFPCATQRGTESVSSPSSVLHSHVPRSQRPRFSLRTAGTRQASELLLDRSRRHTYKPSQPSALSALSPRPHSATLREARGRGFGGTDRRTDGQTGRQRPTVSNQAQISFPTPALAADQDVHKWHAAYPCSGPSKLLTGEPARKS